MAGSRGGIRSVPSMMGRALVALTAAGLTLAFVSGCGGSGSSGTASAPKYTTTVSGTVITAGKAAPTTVDVYEDFLCPICERFENGSGLDIAKAISAGQIQVKYHPVAILDSRTTPQGYSSRAANAAICAAEAGSFQAYHDKLFADQPAEGSAGLTDAELVAMGQEVGVGGSFAQCVTSGKHVSDVKAATLTAAKNTALRRPGSSGFGTPTVVVNGKWVDWSSSTWLSNATK